jgi:hypothetical protein
MKKKKGLKAKIKSWIFENFLQRYLISIDKMFIELFIKYNAKTPIDKMFIELFIKYNAKTPVVKVESHADAEYKRIIKVLTSKKFNDYFYKVVKYDRHIAESLIKPYGKSLKDKIFTFIAEKYIYFFNKELHKSIQQFKRIRDSVVLLNTKIDKYMANTTLDERLNKAVSLGIIKLDNQKAIKRLHNIQAIGIAKIKERNQL